MSGWKIKPARLWDLYVLCGVCLLWVGCSKREPTPEATHILRIAQRNEPATLDPQRASLPDEFFIIRALSEGLVTPDPDGGSPLPATAERWLTSPDGLTWTFHLRRDAVWSNGDPVTAQDFVFTVRRALDPATAAPKGALFLSVKTITAPDNHTLVLTLHQPTPDLLALAASGPWIPVHPASVTTLHDTWTRPGNFIGNGPYLLAEWKPNQHLIVRKNPRYREAAAVTIEEIRFIAFDHGDSEERAFRAGQVDVTMSVPVTKLAGYRTAQPAVLHTVPLHETRYLALNTTRPPLNDARVRRALSLALDRRILCEKVLLGGQRPAFSFIPPGLGGYQPTATLTENAVEARTLLAAAGFPGGQIFPRLELSTWGASTAVLEAIQQRWRTELGIEVVLAQREARTHFAALARGDYAIGFATAIPDYDSATDLLNDLTSDNPGNYPHWHQATYDQLVRANLQLTAESLLLTELPVIPLYFNAQNFLRQPRVTTWPTDRLWTRFYRAARLQANEP